MRQIVLACDEKLTLAEHLVAESNNSLVRVAQLRQAALKWAFEGRLVDQDPNDEPASVLLERIRAEREATKPKKRTRTKKSTQ